MIDFINFVISVRWNIINKNCTTGNITHDTTIITMHMTTGSIVNYNNFIILIIINITTIGITIIITIISNIDSATQL